MLDCVTSDIAIIYRNLLLCEVDPLLDIGYQDARLVSQYSLIANHFLEDLIGGIRLEGAERIVEQVDVRVCIESACECDALLLADTQRDAALADLRFVTSWQLGQFSVDPARGDHFPVMFLVLGQPE